jgi:hypothetical protein
MADSGFWVDGPSFYPLNKIQGRDFEHRGRWNRDIRKKRIVNEWGIGAVNSRWPLFLGRRSFDEDMVPTACETGVLVDSVGLGDRRGCDECKALLESEQWLAL